MVVTHSQATFGKMPLGKGSSLSQDSHPLEAALFQCLDAKARLGETALASMWDSQERPALLQSSLWGLLSCYNCITFSLCPIPHPPRRCSSNKPPTFKSSCQSLFLENLTQDHKRRPHSAAHLPKATDAPRVSGFSQRIVSRSPTDHRGWDALLMGPLFLASSFLDCHILNPSTFLDTHLSVPSYFCLEPVINIFIDKLMIKVCKIT